MNEKARAPSGDQTRCLSIASRSPPGALAFSFIYCGIVQKSNLANIYIFSIVFNN